jgi:hypothetical protein
VGNKRGKTREEKERDRQKAIHIISVTNQTVCHKNKKGVVGEILDETTKNTRKNQKNKTPTQPSNSTITKKR